MDTIIIYGDKRDTEIRTGLLSILSPKFKINYISDNIIKSTVGNKGITIIETSYLNEIELENSILILKNNAKINAIKHIAPKTKVIINSENTKSILRFAQILKNVYTCGFSSKDYVTFSSREDENAIISLQRNIKRLNKTACEPMEIPCRITVPMYDYSILAITLTLILLGIVDENVLNF